MIAAAIEHDYELELPVRSDKSGISAPVGVIVAGKHFYTPMTLQIGELINSRFTGELPGAIY